MKSITLKKYGSFKAVDDLSLTANNGRITILLGPNGVGKSTTIKSITGLLKFDGKILIDGFPNSSVDVKRRFGYIPEMPVLAVQLAGLTVNGLVGLACLALATPLLSGNNLMAD